jgi:hypothetical protein
MPRELTITSRYRWTSAKQEGIEGRGGASIKTTQPSRPLQPKETVTIVTSPDTSPETARRNEKLGQQQPKDCGDLTSDIDLAPPKLSYVFCQMVSLVVGHDGGPCTCYDIGK